VKNKSKGKKSASNSRDWKSILHRRSVKIIAGVVAAFLIFSIGVSVGNGYLSWNSFSSVNGGLPSHLDYSSVNQVYNLIRDNYDGKLTTNQVLDGLKNGLTQATGDQYTEYFNPTQAQQFNDDLSETFSGIGAQIGADAQKNIIVVAPIAGFPAAKAGVKAQDQITSINGKSTQGITPDQAVAAIRGPKGSKVTLDIIRGGTQMSITIVRDNITVPSVTSSVMSGNIGYMQISQFTDDTATLATQAAQKFANDHVKGVILDLRDNPGGLVDAAVAVSSLWLPQGKMILQEKRQSTVIQTYASSGNDLLKGIPTVVLINAGSASASEITAGAIHDNGAAELIGVKSYGKGVVQQIFNLPDKSELKVTIASWYRPDGKNINKLGITPDENIPLTNANTQGGADPQMAAAVTWIQQH
jgi:carboxyl-terminal processing protease